MPADSRLWKLKHGTEFRNRQLMALQCHEQPTPGGIGQRAEAVEDVRLERSIHPYIRIERYTDRSMESRTFLWVAGLSSLVAGDCVVVVLMQARSPVVTGATSDRQLTTSD
jgi:hypothetical protein